MVDLILKAFIETCLMVGLSITLGVIVGLPIGIILYNWSGNGLKPNTKSYEMLSFIVNSARSIPYIILTILLIPTTRFLVGSSIGTAAAIIPLGLSAILLISRGVEDTLKEVPKSLIEVGLATGAAHYQIIRKIILVEALPSIISSITTVAINIVGFSAMAGTIGGGGLGDLAIRYGYQRYDLTVLLAIVVILILIVQIIQMAGQSIIRRCRH